MKLKFSSLSAIIVLCFSISGVGQAETSNIEYRFAYFWSRSDFDVSLLAIDPTDANAPALPLQLLSDPDQYIGRSFSSPDGQWLTFVLFDDDQEGSRIFLQNMLTQETRFVTPHVDTLSQSWSPNSQYLLFRVPEGENDALAPGAYIYEVASDSVTLLAAADNDLDPYAYVWSPDSSQILVVSHACIEGLCERIAARVAELHILDVPSGRRAAEAGFLSEGSHLCDFRWAPDGRRISFTFACEDFLGLDQYLREMWVWNSEGTRFEQITQFTQNFRRRSDIDPTRTYLPFYNSIWYDDEHLLVGLLAGEFSLPEGYRDYDEVAKSISVYAVDGELTTLSSDYVGEWAMNPVSRQVAYRIEQLVPFTNEDDRRTYRPETSRVEVGTFDGSSLSPIHSGPSGCRFSWSPDGRYLAYEETSRTFERCGTFPEKFTFLDTTTGQVSQHTPSEATDVFPVGWIAVAAQNAQPTANAGTDQTVTAADATAQVVLDASASSDTDGTIVAYEWFAGDTVLASGVNPTVELAVGVHTLTLTVTDDNGASASDAVVVTVRAPTATPGATATPQP